MNNKTLRQELEKQVFTIAQALVVSGKHTNIMSWPARHLK
jgi:hypothetical protein